MKSIEELFVTFDEVEKAFHFAAHNDGLVDGRTLLHFYASIRYKKTDGTIDEEFVFTGYDFSSEEDKAVEEIKKMAKEEAKNKGVLIIRISGGKIHCIGNDGEFWYDIEKSIETHLV